MIKIKKQKNELAKNQLKKIALSRIDGLYELAQSIGEPNLSRRYLEIMQSIGKRMDLTIPRNIKRMYCKKCFTIYGTKSLIRLKNGTLSIKCDRCGDLRRIPYR